MKKKQEENTVKFKEDLVKGVREDYLKRSSERAPLERQWELNLNFLMGNQYCDILSNGDIGEIDRQYYWQERKVFNHIAPIIESRLSKFNKITPIVGVKPFGDSDEDLQNAFYSEKLLNQTFSDSKMQSVMKNVTKWSETCGTGFYKVVWNNKGGRKVGNLDGKEVYEGNAEIIAVSPFEIFPDSIYAEEINDCKSIIHAKAVSVDTVYCMYGVKVLPEEVNQFGYINKKKYEEKDKNVYSNCALVIEEYFAPSKEFPNGRLISVCGDNLLYYGELPYRIGENGTFSYPFIRQTATRQVGQFFGQSLIERLIPVQRSFNAVKNRKHEFLSRLSTGTLMVEDGSLDIDDLEIEGLSPGKVLVYRQGSTPPKMLETGGIPEEFSEEENRLLNEFVIISGVSDVTSASSNATLKSGNALSILVEQDNEKLFMSAEEIRNAYLEVAKKILRLYSQFCVGLMPIKYLNKLGKIEVSYADKKCFLSSDCYLLDENEMLYTNADKKQTLLSLYESGILVGNDGKIKDNVKDKILSLLGYKDLGEKNNLYDLQKEKAILENKLLLKGEKNTDSLDDDDIHIEEHTRYFLSDYSNLTDEQKKWITSHVELHKNKIKENVNKENK